MTKMNNIDLVKDIYEFAVGMQYLIEEKSKRKVEDKELLHRSIRLLLSKGTSEEKEKILGINQYIDYKIFSKEFSYYDMDKNLKVFDLAMPELKDGSGLEKKKLLEDMAIDYYLPLEVSFVSARLMEKYYPKEEREQMMNFYRNELI